MFDYKYLTYENVSYDEYSCNQATDKNGTVFQNCTVSGKRIEQKKIWNDISNFDFNGDEKLTFGVFTNVLREDKIEWIPTLFGVRINEWAIFEWDDQILAYYRLNETSGNATEATGNFSNGTLTGSVTQGVGGLINNSYNWTNDAVDSYINLSWGNGYDFGNIISIAFWARLSDIGDGDNPVLVSRGSNFNAINFGSANNTPSFSLAGIGGVTLDNNLTRNEWTFIAAIYNGDDENISIYMINSTGQFNKTATGVTGDLDLDDDWLVGFDDLGGSSIRRYTGQLDEIGFWNRSLTEDEIRGLYSNGNGCTYLQNNCSFNFSGNFQVNLTNPSDAITTTNTSINFTANITSSQEINLTNASLFVWYSNGTLFTSETIQLNNNTLNITNVQYNLTDLPEDDFIWNVESSGFETQNTSNIINNFATSNFTFSVDSISGTHSFNLEVFETSTQTYSINITPFNDTTPTNATLNFDGTEISATITNVGGGNFSFSASQDIPLGVGEKIFNFTFNTNSNFKRSSSNNQTVNALTLGLCNSTLTTTFINFTFKNETLSEEDVNATIDSNWNYYLGSGDVQKTLSFSNATENPSYAFCLNAVNDTLSTQVNVSYTNSISQQRQFRPNLLSLSNVTLGQVLYLLPTTEGIFAQFATQDVVGNSLIGVLATISRTLNGNPITSAIDVTDGAGNVLFFLNPDITYNALFSLSGLSDNSFSFVPVSSLTTVIMGATTTTGDATNISLATSYNITPTNTTLQNGTTVTFQFNISSTETIIFMGINISNGTDTLLLINQTSNGSLSGNVFTGTNRTFIGVFTFSTANETIVVTRVWRIVEGFVGDYSIFNQGTLFLDYEFGDFWRLLIVIFTIIGVLMFMSGTSVEDDEVKMVVIAGIIWFYSVLDWLNTGLSSLATSSSSINDLTILAGQYGVAIISTVPAAYFIFRRMSRS